MLERYDKIIPFFDTIPSEIVIIGEKTGSIALSYAFKKDKKNKKADTPENRKDAESGWDTEEEKTDE